jgi:hypothetical protein
MKQNGCKLVFKHVVKYLAMVGSSLEQDVEPGVGRTFLPIQSERKKNQYSEYHVSLKLKGL